MSEKPECDASARQYVIAASLGSHHHKLFQIIRDREDGISVVFPYFQRTGGQVGLLRIPPNLPSPSNLNVGKISVTTHDVKYTHHVTGQVHFSKDKKVFTSFKKQSVQLKDYDGHLFTFAVQGISNFRKVKPRDLRNKKKQVISIELAPEPPEALEFVVFCTDPASRVAKDRHPLEFTLDASQRTHKKIIIVSVRRVPLKSKDAEVFMSFIGGFDPPHIALNKTAESTCLIFFYPGGKIEELVDNGWPSIDFIPRY